MSHLADEISRQMQAGNLTGLLLSERSGISASQLYKWLNSEQISIGEDQLRALAPALSDDSADHAALVRAHLLDECFGPGSELVRIEIDHPAALKDRPRPRSKGEKALAFFAEERHRNRDLNDLLIDMAKVLGAFEEPEISSNRKGEIGAEGLGVAKAALKTKGDTSRTK